MKISFKSSVGCDARKGCLGGFHLLSWALLEEEGQSKGAGPCVCTSIHFGLRGGQGDLQTQSHCQRDPVTPVVSFPGQKAAPQPGTGCWSRAELVAGWLCVVREWWQWHHGRDVGNEQRNQHSTGRVCSPATTVTTGHNNTGDTSGQPWRCHHPPTPAWGRASGHKELPAGDPPEILEILCSGEEKNWAQHWFPKGRAKMWREY